MSGIAALECGVGTLRDEHELPEGTRLPWCPATMAPTLATPAPAVEVFVASLVEASGAVCVDRLVDALVGDVCRHAVDAPFEFDRDRHRRVLRLQAGGHMSGEVDIREQLRCLRAAPLLRRPALRRRGRVPVSSAVAIDLGVDRRAVPAEAAGDHLVALPALDPGPDLLAFARGQRIGWHAVGLHRSGVGVDSGHHARHLAPTGGGSDLRCSRHPLNSP